MKKRKERSFGSLDEIMKTYMPNYKSLTESPVVSEPGPAGELLAEQLLKTMRSALNKGQRRA